MREPWLVIEDGAIEQDGFEDLCLLYGADDYRYGVSRITFLYEDHVVKVPFAGIVRDGERIPYVHDPCMDEIRIFARAKGFGLQGMLNPVLVSDGMVGERDYVSPYCEPLTGNDLSLSLSEDTCGRFSDRVRGILEEQHGKAKTDFLLKFLLDEGVDDFHEGNFGWGPDGKLRIIDYAPYLEDVEW